LARIGIPSALSTAWITNNIGFASSLPRLWIAGSQAVRAPRKDANSYFDKNLSVLDGRFVGFDRNHAWRGDHLAGFDVELTVVEIALDNIVLDIAFRKGARAVRAGIIGHKELAFDVKDGECEIITLDPQRTANFDIGCVA
jgi:hypothetical protein